MKYKVGDRVKIQSLERYNKCKNRNGNINYGRDTEILFTSKMSSFCGQVVTITRVRYIGGVRFYNLAEDDGIHLWVSGMFEGLVGEEVELIDELSSGRVKEFNLPEGYQFVDEKGNVINAKKIVLEKKEKEYPKTYEECCKVMNYCCNPVATKTTHKEELIRKFQFLLLYRDAYWKIAGDEMGLGKPWEPDYDSGVNKYGIICMNGVVQESNSVPYWERHLNKILDFPTPEMRDAFKENFDPDIEMCKEFL